MTDTPQWQAPGYVLPPPPPTVGYPVQPPPPAPGWTPPPRPGLIPLRPLTLGTILGASFRVLRRNPRPTFGIALLIQGITYIVSLAVVGVVFAYAFSRIDFATGENTDAISAGSSALLGLSGLVPLGLSLLSSALLQGIIVLEVSRATLGEKQKLSQLWARGRGRLGALIGYAFLVALAGIIALALIVALIVLFVSTLGAAGVVIGILVGVFGGLALLAAFVWVSVKLAFVPSALVLERLTIRQAIVRSWTLTRGYFWRTLGIEALVIVILSTASGVVTGPIGIIYSILAVLLDPNGQLGQGFVVLTVVYYVVVLALSVVIGAITAVVETATTALLYIDLRIRKEGLDLDLARFVEARQAGDTSVPDPYLPRATPAA